MSKFDLSQFELSETATLTVLNPRGEELTYNGNPVKITLYGAGSKEYVAAKYKFDNANTALMRAMLSNKQVKNAAEETAKNTAEFLAACTANIDNFPIDGGALAIYSNPKLKYITDQVDKFLGESENFMPSLSAN